MIPYGGTFVRRGVIAWDGVLARSRTVQRGGSAFPLGLVPPATDYAAPSPVYSPCDVVEQALAAAIEDPGQLDDLLDELGRAQLWLPLPGRPGRVTDGSAIALPVINASDADFVPAFTSVQRLATWADPRTRRSDRSSARGPLRSGDPAWMRDLADGTGVIPHIVVPFPGLASLLPHGLGIAVNSGTTVSARVYPDAVAIFGLRAV